MHLFKPYLFNAVALVCIVVLCMGFSNIGIKNANIKPRTHVVTIYKMKYNPANFNVRKGDTVVWINKDFFQHDVTEETNQKWTSKPFGPGEKWSKVIKEDVAYFCNLHKVMKGTITVDK